MLTKTSHWIFVLPTALLIGLLAMLSLPARASAEKTTDAGENSCLSCHEELYYLHDSGKHCCITEHADHCVDCHEGNKAVMSKEESHQGLLAHPQENNGEKCLECHTPEVVQTRLAEMASTVGFDTVIKAEPYTPSVQVAAGFPDVAEANHFQENLPWIVGALTLFGLWLLLVLFSPTKP
jgi:hypothetical protein